MACGFGIVVIDMDKMEVKDTYYIGPNGGYINVYDITMDGTFIYAATSGGIYKASLSSANLSNFINWSLMPGLPTGVYNSIGYINGKIVTSYSKYLTTIGNSTPIVNQDTLFYYDYVSWKQFTPPGAFQFKKINISANQCIVTILV